MSGEVVKGVAVRACVKLLEAECKLSQGVLDPVKAYEVCNDLVPKGKGPASGKGRNFAREQKRGKKNARRGIWEEDACNRIKKDPTHKLDGWKWVPLSILGVLFMYGVYRFRVPLRKAAVAGAQAFIAEVKNGRVRT